MEYNFLRFPFFKDKAFTVSYDDGCFWDEKLVEILDKYNIKGTFNINSGLALSNDDWHLPLNKLKEIYDASNHEVAVHGLFHRRLEQLEKTNAISEVLDDRKNLEKYFGRIINGMAYAYGTFNDDCINLLKDCGIKYSRTVISTGKFDIPTDWLKLPATCHHNDPKLFDLANDFIKPLDKNENPWKLFPKLFLLWGHSHEYARDNNWNRLEKLCELVANRKDVWYATIIDIYNYVKAFDNLIWSSNGDVIFNPSSIDVYICYLGKNIIVKAGQTVIL